MKASELRSMILFEIDEYYRNTPNEELPVEYQIAACIEANDVMVLEDYSQCPEGYIYIVLVDLYEETLADAVEFILKQSNK